MKTNLTSLMSVAAEEEEKLSQYAQVLRLLAYNISTQELNGTVNIIEDYKEDFDEGMEAYNAICEKIIKIKSIIYEKNNEFKLADGRSIQEAIVHNKYLRKKKSLYRTLLEKKSSKNRVTEVNNSYFECRTINFDAKQISKEVEEMEKRIQETDFEISKLNSIEFEVEI